MSRVGKLPIDVPSGVQVTLGESLITVKGALGLLERSLHVLVKLSFENNVLSFETQDSSRTANVMSGTLRALIKNMVDGVSKGFQKKLLLVGVGYRAQVQGDKLQLSLGYSHPIVYSIPEGIKCEVPTQTEIIVKGIDKQKVGQVAAEIRAFREPEPYKGKGVRYEGEKIILKETKKK